jgi:hypothetical protein
MYNLSKCCLHVALYTTPYIIHTLSMYYSMDFPYTTHILSIYYPCITLYIIHILSIYYLFCSNILPIYYPKYFPNNACILHCILAICCHVYYPYITHISVHTCISIYCYLHVYIYLYTYPHLCWKNTFQT